MWLALGSALYLFIHLFGEGSAQFRPWVRRGLNEYTLEDGEGLPEWGARSRAMGACVSTERCHVVGPSPWSRYGQFGHAAPAVPRAVLAAPEFVFPRVLVHPLISRLWCPHGMPPPSDFPGFLPSLPLPAEGSPGDSSSSHRPEPARVPPAQPYQADAAPCPSLNLCGSPFPHL